MNSQLDKAASFFTRFINALLTFLLNDDFILIRLSNINLNVASAESDLAFSRHNDSTANFSGNSVDTVNEIVLKSASLQFLFTFLHASF